MLLMFLCRYRALVHGSPQAFQTMRVEPQNATRFTVYQLEPLTLYEFKVLSRNELGAGKYSEVVRAKTKGIAGSQSPCPPQTVT